MKRIYAYVALVITGFLAFFWIATPADASKQLITNLVFFFTGAGLATFICLSLRKKKNN